MWVRSRTTGDSFGYGVGLHELRLDSGWREVGIEVRSFVPPHAPTNGFFYEPRGAFSVTPSSPDFFRFHPDLGAVPFWLRLGFGRSHLRWKIYTSVSLFGKPPPIISNATYWFAPWWAVWFATTVLPAMWIVQRRRTSRRPKRVGFCSRCGYDLRATPDRCPECGTVPMAKGTT